VAEGVMAHDLGVLGSVIFDSMATEFVAGVGEIEA
jgi:hypothetical protein